ncbi:MAG: hypothetical protein R2838_12545 [Caldilineaceae bacterium]
MPFALFAPSEPLAYGAEQRADHHGQPAGQHEPQRPGKLQHHLRAGSDRSPGVSASSVCAICAAKPRRPACRRC